jgi:tRNA G37 N-methylase Trm5
MTSVDQYIQYNCNDVSSPVPVSTAVTTERNKQTFQQSVQHQHSNHMLQSQPTITQQACLKEHNNMQYRPTSPPLRFYFVGYHKVTVLLSITNKMQRYAILFNTANVVHVSVSFYAHHQEFKTLHTASGMCQVCLLLALA